MIGVMAYGSLITNPGSELAGVTVRESQVVTPFSVEYARSSKRRFGAPTLVPVDAGGSRVRAIVFEVDVNAEEATNIVYRREINQVGSDMTYSEPATNSDDAVFIDRIKGIPGFDTVLSTRIAANIPSPSGDSLADLAIQSVKPSNRGRDGISYLIDAKRCGIETPLSPVYEECILKKTATESLVAALRAIAKDFRSA